MGQRHTHMMPECSAGRYFVHVGSRLLRGWNTRDVRAVLEVSMQRTQSIRRTSQIATATRWICLGPRCSGMVRATGGTIW